MKIYNLIDNFLMNDFTNYLKKYSFKVIKKKNILSTSILSNIKSIDIILINNNLNIK